MNLISGLKNLLTKNKSMEVSYTTQRKRYSGSVGYKKDVPDYRTDPKRISDYINDGTVVKCMQLISNYTLGNGWVAKARYNYQQEEINRFLKSQNIDKINREILNSILGVNGSILAFFVEKDQGLGIAYESFFWNNYQRIWADIDDITKEFTHYKIKTQFQRSIYFVDKDKSFLLNALNFENDYAGKSPLMYAQEAIAEKQALSLLNKKTALAGGRVKGALSPKADLIKDMPKDQHIAYLADLGYALDEMQTNSSNEGVSYALIPPADFIRFQSSNSEMEFEKRIRALNYEICGFYGVPPSLVGFDETTDPNLANGEEQKDSFIASTVNHYKTLLEEYWTWTISQMYPTWEFSFFIGREQTDETIKIRDQLHQSVDTVLKLQSIGVEAEVDISLLNKLGIKIKEKTDLSGNVVNQVEVEQQAQNRVDQLSIAEEAEMKDKGLIYDLTIDNEPNVVGALSYWGDEKDKAATKAKIIIQWQGYKIGVQYSLGDLRHGKKMRCGYGYILNTRGEDGMALDVYIGDNLGYDKIYRVTQLDPDTGELDEYKYMIGFFSIDEAKDCYLGHIPQKFFGGIEESGFDEINRYSTKRTTDNLIPAKDKAERPKYKDLTPPSFESLSQTKGYKDFKKRLKAKINNQLEALFENIDIKDKAISDNDLLYQYIQDNLPRLDYTDRQLYQELVETVIPESLKLYNDFYKKEHTIDQIPSELRNRILDLANITINGIGETYRGIDETLAKKIYSAFNKIKRGLSYDIDEYSSLPDNVKKEIWFELKKNNRTILLQSRTDLISQVMANNSLNLVQSELAKVDIKGTVYVGVATMRDDSVRGSHAINEGNYFPTSLKQPWLDLMCRCFYVFGEEDYLISLGFKKLKF